MNLFNQQILDVLGWTLLHFTWQGSLVALAAFGVLHACRTASSRYLAASFAMVIMCALPMGTFVSLLPNNAPATPASTSAAVQLPTSASATVGPAQISSSPRPLPAIVLTQRVDQALPYLVSAWLAGVLVLSLRLTLGLIGVRRLTVRGIEPAPAHVLLAFRRLVNNLKLSRPVRLFVSTAVTVPQTVGYLKPVILLPLSALTGLSPRQIEVVIAHELAHVRRCDYLVNLVQTVMETLLFYHPAVWWISRVIRSEREHACDDLALVTCGADGVVLARALTSLEELRSRPSVFALAASGGSLMQRVSRLTQPRTPIRRQPYAWSAGIVAAGLMLLVFAIGASSTIAEPETTPSISKPQVMLPAVNLPPVPVHRSAEKRAGLIPPPFPPAMDSLSSTLLKPPDLSAVPPPHFVDDERKELLQPALAEPDSLQPGTAELPFQLKAGPDGEITYKYGPEGKLKSITATNGATLKASGWTLQADSFTIDPTTMKVIANNDGTSSAMTLQPTAPPRAEVEYQYAVIIGTEDRPHLVEQLKLDLEAAGYNQIIILKDSRSNAEVVALGPFSTRSSAESARQAARRDGYMCRAVQAISPGNIVHTLAPLTREITDEVNHLR